MTSTSSEISSLRAITFRISSIPTAQLPQQIPAISTSLINCKSLLSSSQTSGLKASPEGSTIVHKYRTLLSSLLQDRSIQGRWAATVLVKTSVEIGGWETLQKSLPWIRGLLGILSKPDPPSSKKLCILTLTRIFLLTRDFPTLIREITTPNLPAFIQSCLQLATSKTSRALLQPILGSFGQLLPRHPTIFRSYLKQIKQILSHTVAPTPSNKLGREQYHGIGFHVSLELAEASRKLYVLLPQCAPKGVSSEEWDSAFTNLLSNVHCTADKVFRAVIEDWKPSSRPPIIPNGQTLEDEPQQLQLDPMDLPPWLGLYAGSERLIGLLRLIKAFLACPTANTIIVRVSSVVDLLTRVFSITIPSSTASKDFINTVRYNNQVSKEERNHLWAVLPRIHVVSLEILSAIAARSEQVVLPLVSALLDQIVWVFNSEKGVAQIRTASYMAIGCLLGIAGPSLPKPSIDPLGNVVQTCCLDLLPQDALSPSLRRSGQTKMNGSAKQQTSTNADTFLNSDTAQKGTEIEYRGLKAAAYDLLPLLLSQLPAQFIADSVRARMDRTATLIKHKQALVASVLNPPPNKKFGKPAASLLPLMTRSFPDDQNVEAMIRPRMPVLRTGPRDSEIDSEAIDEAIEEVEDEDENAHFVGEELDALLDTANNIENMNKDGDAVKSSGNAAGNNLISTAAPSVSEAASLHKEGTTGQEPVVLNSTNKRSTTSDAPEPPMSPSKRVKVDDSGNEDTVATQPIIPTAVAVPPDTGSTAREAVAATIIPTKVEPLTKMSSSEPIMEEDSDNDDFGELVLGQDSDESDE